MNSQHFRPISLLIFFALSLSVLPAISAPKAKKITAQDVELKAKNISRDYETRTVLLEGNVIVRYGDDKIMCDKALVNLKKREVVAEGNVSLESGDTYIEGEKISYNFDTKIGEIQKGLVQSGQIVFLGDIIKKNSEKHYVATDAQYSSCATCPPAWSISGSEIEAEIGGYANIKYPVLRVADFPIFILPRIIFPLKSKRQTGVLVPKIIPSSVGGAAIELPYFWAISDSQDLTYSLRNYETKGQKHWAEYRYVLSEQSSGNLRASYLEDQSFTANGEKDGPAVKLKRGFLNYDHRYVLPDNYIHRADLTFINDLRYPRDFSEDLKGHGDPAIENKVSLTHNTNIDHFSLEAVYLINLLKEDPLADNNDAVHRFPEIKYQVVENEFMNTNLYYKFDFNYVNFARRDFSYDDITGVGTGRNATTARDGQYDPNNDLIRTGQRFSLQPSVSYPFHVGELFDVTPSVTYNETQYRFNASPDVPVTDPERTAGRSAERRYLETDLSIRTKYSRVFGDDPTADRIKHEIEPEITYSRIPWAEQPNHVFFGNYEDQPASRYQEPLSNSDFYGESRVQFDYKDRLFEKDVMTFTLSNYFIQKKITESGPIYQRVALFRLGQSYDFSNARQENGHPWSSINGLLDMRFPRFETHSSAEYYPYANITNWQTRIKIKTLMANYYEVTYAKSLIIDENNEPERDSKKETIENGLGFQTKYLNFAGKVSHSLITRDRLSRGYEVIMKPPGDCLKIKYEEDRALGQKETHRNISLVFEFSGA